MNSHIRWAGDFIIIHTSSDTHCNSSSDAARSRASTRVVVAVWTPDLWRSQMIVFFGSKYFDTFFNRNNATQRWTQLEENRSLVWEWKINLPNTFSERGYHEEINEPDFHQSGELWFIGQLSAA